MPRTIEQLPDWAKGRPERADAYRREIRPIQIRAQTVNEDQHSVEAIIATDSPVEVWDWRRGEIIEEILLTTADAVGLPRGLELPLLELHDRWSMNALIGSARSIQREDEGIAARLDFVKDDAEADKTWNKIRQGHVRDVSIGYHVAESVRIEAEQTVTIAGREFTAGKVPLVIGTRWSLKETSVVPIGADQDAKLRQQTTFARRGIDMSNELRTYLESIGLRADVSDEEAQKFFEGLSGEQRTRAESVIKLADAKKKPADPPAEPPQPRGEGRGASGEQTPPATPPEDPEAVAQRVIRAERDRVRQIGELAGDDVPQEIRQQAINDGWDVNRASREFLAAVRANRQPNGGPAIHAHSREGSLSARSLAAGLLIGQHLDPTKQRMHDGQQTPRRADRLTEQDADQGDEFSALSFVDIVRECARLDTGRHILDPREAFRTAVSGATLTLIFTTNAYANLMQGWDFVGDSTVGWCDETDESNFLQREDISLTASARLQQLARGDTAKHATASDTRETWKLARYAKQFAVDEQDMLDDRLNAIMRMPQEMGEAARRLRPDLVYSLINENPSLVADSTAVFDSSTHANLGTGVLGPDTLKAGILAMGKHRINQNVLNIAPRFLLVASALRWTAKELTKYDVLQKLFATSNDPYYSPMNVLAEEGITPRVDDRLGTTGVLDPRTESMQPGSDTAWYLASGGIKSIRVAYLRGTNRSPVMRSFILDKGQWGIGWDINLDIAAAFMEYRTWYKSDGTG